MSAIKDAKENLTMGNALLTERGILGGLYFALVLFILLIPIIDFSKYKEIVPWILLMILIFGITISYVSYELFMPIFGQITDPIIRRSANELLKKSDSSFSTYSELREFREKFLGNEAANNHLKNQIKMKLGLRQTLTYLASTNLVTTLLLVLITILFPTDNKLTYIILFVIAFIFISTLIGIIFRAKSLGRHIGMARQQEPNL